MSLIYITGIAGAGKSQVYKELKSRDYMAYGTDEDRIAGFYNNETGERMAGPYLNAVDRTPEWRKLYTWKIDRKELDKLAIMSKDKNTFLCGVAANEEKFLDVFDMLFALVIDETTLEARIKSRTNNDFGKVAHELQSIKEWQKSTEDYYQKYNFIKIDATQPIYKVVNDILANI